MIFIIGLIMRSDMGHKISILKLLLFGIGAIMLFVVAYIPVLGFSLDNLEFLMPHFCKYLFSGVAGFNEILFKQQPLLKEKIFIVLSKKAPAI